MGDTVLPEEDGLIIADEHGNWQSKDGDGKGAPPIDFGDLPTDHEELDEYVKAKAVPAIAKSIALAERFADELATRDLGREDVGRIMQSLTTATSRLTQLSTLISETAPRTIRAMFNFALPDGSDTCPCCQRPWPEDLSRDMSGFDKPGEA